MSAFSSIAKGFKKIVKGVSKVFKAVGSAVKGFVGSKLGRIILIGAAIWLGGATIGMWNSGFASIDGALVATQAGAAAPAAAEAGSLGVGTAATEGTAAVATGGLSGAAPVSGTVAGVGGGGTGALSGFASAPEVSAFSLAPSAAPAGLMQTGGLGLTASPAALTQNLSGGFMSTAGKAVSGAAKWMAANPIPTLVGGQMLANAFTPNAIDVADAEAKRRQEEIDAANARLAQVGGIPTFQYSGAKLPPPQPPVTRPAGIFGRRLV